MTPAQMIGTLDRALKELGQDVTLRRSTWVGKVATHIDAPDIRGHVSGYLPDELVGGIVQGDRKVILSPTGIIGKNWPTSDATAEQRVPQIGDVIIANGRTLRVMVSAPSFAAGELVRIDLQVRG